MPGSAPGLLPLPSVEPLAISPPNAVHSSSIYNNKITTIQSQRLISTTFQALNRYILIQKTLSQGRVLSQHYQVFEFYKKLTPNPLKFGIDNPQFLNFLQVEELKSV